MNSAGYIKAGNLRWFTQVRGRDAMEAIWPVLQQPEAFLQDPSCHIKRSRVVTIARVPPNLILRRLNYGKLIHRLRDCFRPSRAMRALIASMWLAQAGIRTPRALAAADVRALRWPITAYLITEEVSGARTLATLVASKQKIPPGIAEMIAHLHSSGFSHRDLKWTNILFDELLSPWLIDLDGVRRLGRVPNERAREDLWTLARCFASHPVILKWSGGRFLYRYCALRNLPFKPWAAALILRIGRR